MWGSFDSVFDSVLGTLQESSGPDKGLGTGSIQSQRQKTKRETEIRGVEDISRGRNMEPTLIG